ncbi:MAG: hypothetical protein E7001_06925 [Coriobacteriaceae bacterium]|nr:hypothetical protein [Coriobacteriaceae bacterium]
MATVPEALAAPALYRPAPGTGPVLDRDEMLRYLGYAGQEMDPGLAARIAAVADEVEAGLAPAGVRRVFPVDATGTDGAGEPVIRLHGTAVALEGKDIFRHLKDARYCALIACTLGIESERRLRAAGGAALEQTVLDAACSAYVEAAVEEMDAAVRAEAAELGLSTNWRFSCGYGDCPLTAQPRIVAALNAGRLIGLTVTPANLLVPSKSVTAMIGLFDGPVHDANTRPACGICRLRGSCAFRARGTTCYGG